jgi:hypothetical protein
MHLLWWLLLGSQEKSACPPILMAGHPVPTCLPADLNGGSGSGSVFSFSYPQFANSWHSSTSLYFLSIYAATLCNEEGVFLPKKCLFCNEKCT